MKGRGNTPKSAATFKHRHTDTYTHAQTCTYPQQEHTHTHTHTKHSHTHHILTPKRKEKDAKEPHKEAYIIGQGVVVVHTFDSSTQKAKARPLVNSRPV